MYPYRRVKVEQLPAEYRPEIDALPGDLRLIARAVEEELPGFGVLAALAIGNTMPGAKLHVHNVRKIMAAFWEDQLRAEYDAGGVTAQELALKYGIGQRHAEKILASVSQEKLQSKQMSLF